ncbi:glycosyltransferase family 2 protein [uncultured Massilia sp.]|uniref:glycosyltransferase family 2 protein n=1 Tax=uncultured Massilia sp. TaxID=169973 RepID=UPI0025EF14D6|nr:hypothetical protein [uncultured Massilia sp.]
MNVLPSDTSCSLVCGSQAPAHVERLLATLAGMRIYLVDASRDGRLRAPALRAGAHYRHAPGDASHARGHNWALRAAAAAGSRHHAILDPGLEVAPAGLARLFACLRRDPGIGLLAPRVRGPGGRLRPLCTLLPHPCGFLARRVAPLLYRASGCLARHELHGGYARPMDVPVPPLCCTLLRVEVALDAGLFDERLPAELAQADLARRVGRAARVAYLPHVTVVHAGPRARTGWRELPAALRYFDKWGWWRDEERARINARALRACGVMPGRMGHAAGPPARLGARG